MIETVRNGVRAGGGAEAFKQAFLDNLYHTRGQALQSASLNDLYMTLGYTVRDYLVEGWQRTVDRYYDQNPKFVCYLSAEYLPGCSLAKHLTYTGTTDHAQQALSELGIDMASLIEQDVEPGLGNGGLGRLASCFLDSLATLGIPSIGYGIRYEYGIFKQSFHDGWQIEHPDEWLLLGHPWEFRHADDIVSVGFGGHSETYLDAQQRERTRWVPERYVRGEPYHVLVPGYGNDTVNMLRLWRARASQGFDFQLFNDGDYTRAVAEKTQSENLSKVLYPNDNTAEGQELRLKQQYFFVCCSIQDIIRRFHIRNEDWELFPQKVVIQLNDTHPVVAIPELMRQLVDHYMLPWDRAWDLTTRTFAYTCHTLQPEALERWPVGLFGRILPRHLQIVYEINRRFLEDVGQRYAGDEERLRRLSLIEEGPEKRVRMAHLATVGSFSVNGVAGLHTELLKHNLLGDFHEMTPDKFNNKTNGVTPRRFMRLANPALSDLITSKIGDGWLKDLEKLSGLEKHADDSSFHDDWRQVKQLNKTRLADYILTRTGITVDAASIFDVMVKRMHEYKRQLLMLLHIVSVYQRLKTDPDADVVPRTFIFGAKAAPGYHQAKLIIKLINSVADVVNRDADVRGRLKVVFLENFNVTMGERIYPAADLSEQISMAGREASGTGNMKMALNGALTIGTFDGANIEILDRVGAENFFLFGMRVEDIFTMQRRGYDAAGPYHRHPVLKAAVDGISAGDFSNGDRELFKSLVDAMLQRDEFLVLADFGSYLARQEDVERAYRDRKRWTRMSILNTARSGYFSSDRTIGEYCADIWDVEPFDTSKTARA